MASTTGTLYTGVTGDLKRRVWEHKQGVEEGFTKKYKCNKLVYFEEGLSMLSAIGREKQIKGWVRTKKQNLIKTINPSWNDLAKDW